jgi:UDPglucose 6-dehydrogenase
MPYAVTVAGAGYVGLVSAACLASSGHRVTCVDVDTEKVRALQSSESPIYEPGLDDVLSRCTQDGTLAFTTPENGWAELLGDVVIVAVGTPMASNGAADLSYVHAVVSAIASQADHDLVLVMKSTVPPGTGAMLSQRYLTNAAHDLAYVSNPEFLREGHAVHDWFKTDRIVLGTQEGRGLDAMRGLYADIEAPVLATDITSAETIKYASNAFLSTKISFINEIANLCDCVDADIDAVSRGIGMDKRIGGAFLNAGVGYGGSCFPKDTRALDFIATLNGYRFDLLKAVIEVNNRQRLLPVMHVLRHIGDLHERKVAILGLAFKPDTDDVRESPALDVIPLLAEEGCRIDIYDPLAAPVPLGSARRVDTAQEAIREASAVILLTEWPELVELDWAEVHSLMVEPRIVFDGRNALDASAVRDAGLSYAAIGRDGDHRADSA